MIVGLTPIVRQKLHTAAHEPVHRVGAVGHQRLSQVGIDVVLGDAAEVVEIFFRRVFAEIRPRDIGVAEIGDNPLDVLHAMMDHPETAAGEVGISAALGFGCTLDQCDLGALLGSGESSAKRSITAAHNDDIVRLSVH